jgi:hypothetical protein
MRAAVERAAVARTSRGTGFAREARSYLEQVSAPTPTSPRRRALTLLEASFERARRRNPRVDQKLRDTFAMLEGGERTRTYRDAAFDRSVASRTAALVSRSASSRAAILGSFTLVDGAARDQRPLTRKRLEKAPA